MIYGSTSTRRIRTTLTRLPLLLLQCTKNKTWKDIAAQLGIGASSSGAYTLKKHYGKNLLPFECHFDRGGIDPGPLLAQVEATSKKKPAAKNSANTPASSQPPPAPSPGSQDSRDSSNFGPGGENSGPTNSHDTSNYGGNGPYNGPPPPPPGPTPGYPPYSSAASGPPPGPHHPGEFPQK